MNLHWQPREVTRYVEIVIDGKKKKVKSVKLYLDFTVTTDHGDSFLYTAHVYSDGSNRPEIRIKDPRGDARDPEKPVSRNLDNFQKENRWMGALLLGVIINGVTEAHQDKLLASIARWEQKREEKQQRRAA